VSVGTRDGEDLNATEANLAGRSRRTEEAEMYHGWDIGDFRAELGSITTTSL